MSCRQLLQPPQRVSLHFAHSCLRQLKGGRSLQAAERAILLTVSGGRSGWLRGDWIETPRADFHSEKNSAN